MTGNEQLIETIVRAVLEEIQRGKNSARIAQASGGRKPPVANNNPSQSFSETKTTCTLETPVITGDCLEQNINGAKRIIIGRQTVLTPSARDLLRQRGIAVERQTAAVADDSNGGRWGAVVAQCTPALESALDDASQLSGVVVSRELVGTNDEAVRMAVDWIHRDDVDGSVLFTEQPQRAACLANRNRSVRAAVAADAATVKAATAAMGANLLCVNPVDLPFFGLRNMLRQLSAGGPPRVPPDWPE